MTNNGGTLRGISWRDLCPWLVIFRSFGVSVSLPVLMLALVGALISPVGWWISGWVFSSALESDSVIRQIVEQNRRCPCVPDPEISLTIDDLGSSAMALPRAWYRRFVLPFEMMFDVNLTLSRFCCLLMGGLISLCVWAFFGGAIARIAIMQFGLEERVSLKDAVTLACRKWGSYVAAPILPLLGVFVVALLSGGWLGLIMIFNSGSIIGGFLWIVALVGGFVMAILLLGLVFGWPLMWTTISAEGSDAFDGLSRAYAYTFQRPLHYLFYGVLATSFGLLCFTLVLLFSEGVIQLTYWSVSWGANLPDLFASPPAEQVPVQEVIPEVEQTRVQELMLAERHHRTGSEMTDMPTSLVVGSWFVYAANGLVRATATAFTYSFFWCAMSAVYLLLRRDVDQTEFDEIWVEEDRESATLPDLTADQAGAPQLAQEPIEAGGPADQPGSQSVSAGDQASDESPSGPRSDEAEEPRPDEPTT